ncbi:MAG: 30S ribosomal protein S6 [Thermodesulfobacteriota bacterium]
MSQPYELIFIVKPDVGEEVIQAAVQKVTGVVAASKGEMLTVDEWGKRKLAYPIQKCTEGYYLYLKFTTPPEAIKEIERQLKLNEQVIRYLTVKLDPRKMVAAVEENEAESEGESTEVVQPVAEEGGSI